MRTLQLYDLGRKPAHWNEHLAEGEYAVFLSDVTGGNELMPNGESLGQGAASACYVFDNLEEASKFSNGKVAEFPRMRCEVFDRRGRAERPVLDISRRIPNAHMRRRMRRIGAGLLLLCPLLVWFDWRHDWLVILPTVLGMNCLAAGLRLIYMGYAVETPKR